MDAAVTAKPSTAQDTVRLSHQTRRFCGVSCAGRRGAKWLGEKRGLSEYLSSSFFSVCSRWNDGGRGRRERRDGMWRRLLALPARAPGRLAGLAVASFPLPTASSPPWSTGALMLYGASKILSVHALLDVVSGPDPGAAMRLLGKIHGLRLGSGRTTTARSSGVGLRSTVTSSYTARSIDGLHSAPTTRAPADVEAQQYQVVTTSLRAIHPPRPRARGHVREGRLHALLAAPCAVSSSSSRDVTHRNRRRVFHPAFGPARFASPCGPSSAR
jgi:hypothetical protein